MGPSQYGAGSTLPPREKRLLFAFTFSMVLFISGIDSTPGIAHSGPLDATISCRLLSNIHLSCSSLTLRKSSAKLFADLGTPGIHVAVRWGDWGSGQKSMFLSETG